jgi:hypothetical protein
MCLSIHRRWCGRARIAKNEVRQDKMYLISFLSWPLLPLQLGCH